jgi:hypothetical protein
MPQLRSIPALQRRFLRLALASSALAIALISSPADAQTAAAPTAGGAAVAPAPLVVAGPLVVATAPAVPPPATLVVASDFPPEPTTILLAEADTGVAVVPGRGVGVYGNLGMNGIFNADRRRLRPVWGVSCAWDFFVIPGRGEGGGLNLGFLAGLKSPTMIATIGAGTNLFTVDSLDTTGIGVFSPRASARIGILLGSFHLGAIGGVERRWQWKSDNHTLITAGLMFGGAIEEADRPSRRDH